MSTELTTDVETFKAAALALPMSARAYLAEALLESLEYSDEDLAVMPVAEDALTLAEERLRAIREGRAQTVALDDSIARFSAGQPA